MSLLAYLNPFGNIIDKVGKAIDDNVTSDEERLTLQKEMQELSNQFNSKILELEMKTLETQANVLNTELKGDNWLQKSWRPLTMLAFVGLIISYWLGYNPPNLTQVDREWLFRIIAVGIGGYTLGRSGEKIAKVVKKDKNIDGLPWLN